MMSGDITTIKRETEMQIRKGTKQDIDEVAALYDALNEYLDSHINYPGWKKGIYPIREDAVNGIEEEVLFLAEEAGRIIGTVILRHVPENGYETADWHNSLEYKDIFVVYTLAVHPEFLQQGTGKQIMEFVLKHAAAVNMKAVRLDVYEKNFPAIHLYERMGFQYIDTVDLGYSMHGLDRFRLYQRII